MDPQSGSETRMKGFYAQIKAAAFRSRAEFSLRFTFLMQAEISCQFGDSCLSRSRKRKNNLCLCSSPSPLLLAALHRDEERRSFIWDITDISGVQCFHRIPGAGWFSRHGKKRCHPPPS